MSEMSGMAEVPPAPPGPLPRYVERPRQRGHTALVVGVVILGCAAVAISVFFAATAGSTGGAVLSVAYALVPLPLLWFGYWWLDRYEPEPRRYKAAAFLWGAVGAVSIALVVELAATAWLPISDSVAATVVAPLAEEPAKGLFLLLTFLRWRRIIDGLLDGIVLAGLVGLGFAYLENIIYYSASYVGIPDVPLQGVESATTTFIVRGIASPLAHPLFTTAFGLGVAGAVLVRSRLLKVTLAGAGMGGSIFMHGLWNGAASFGGGVGFVIAYLFLALVLFALIAAAIVLRVRQVGILERSLSHAAERGWLHPAEIPYIVRFAYRRRAAAFAGHHGGPQRAQATRRYQLLAVRLGHLHHAVMSGRSLPHGVERTLALVESMRELRPWVLLPPPMAPLRPGGASERGAHGRPLT